MFQICAKPPGGTGRSARSFALRYSEVYEAIKHSTGFVEELFSDYCGPERFVATSSPTCSPRSSSHINPLFLPKIVGTANVFHRMSIWMSVRGRRYFQHKRAGSITFRVVQVAFWYEHDLRIFGHFNFADRSKRISSEVVRLKT